MRDLAALLVLITFGALLTGAFVLLLALALAVLCGWPVLYAFVAAAGSSLFAWLVWTGRAVEVLENLSGVDRRKPPAEGPKEINLRIHAEGESYPTGFFLDRLPVGEQELLLLARRALNGESLTTSAMTGSGMDRSTWELLRDRLIGAGLLAWRGGNRQYGVELTSRGWAVFRHLVDPTPLSESASEISSLERKQFVSHIQHTQEQELS